jgi:hypothetical protein
MKTSDAPEAVSIECNPIDFEQAREQLERHGYQLISAEPERGRLVLVGVLRACQCDLCRDKTEQ